MRNDQRSPRAGRSRLSMHPNCPPVTEVPSHQWMGKVSTNPLALTLVNYEEAAWCLPTCRFPHWSQDPQKPEPESRQHSRAVSGGQSGADWGAQASPHTVSPALSPEVQHKVGAVPLQLVWKVTGRVEMRTTAHTECWLHIFTTAITTTWTISLTIPKSQVIKHFL